MDSRTSRGGLVAVEGLCPECGSALGSSLYRHLFNIHSYSKDDIERLKKQKRACKVLSATNEAYTCDVCGLVYATKETLARHKREKGHNAEIHLHLSCPLCEQQVMNHWHLINHCNEDHATMENQYVVETASFDDKAKFEVGVESKLIGIRNKVDPARRDDVDIRSVEMRVQENAAEDGIRVYTPAINETGEGFSLVIITPVQESWLAKYGARAICMDDTFNLTSYCLRLATVVVVDEWDRGLPAAYLLSNRMTENEVASMFEEVKALLPNFDPEYFMSDDCNSFYNGFLRVFPLSRAQKLLCSFHVIQAVKRNCRARLKQKDNTEKVLASVRSLCRTSNPDVFASRYASLITFLNTQGEKDMTEYFEKTWSARIQQWGGFARRNASVGTSMLIERFHRRLKHEVSNTKANMRIDTLMEILISLVPSMEEDRRIMMARGLRAGRYRLTQNHRAHALAVKLFGTNQEDIHVLEEGLWTVTDRRGVHYVEQQFCLCNPKINNHCSMCKACAYAFLCDCPQDARAGISCAHIHAALIYAPEGMLTTMPEWSSSLPAERTSGQRTPSRTDEHGDGLVYVYEAPERTERLYQNQATASIDILDTNKELLQEFESVTAALRSKMMSLSKVAHAGVQQQMRKCIEMMRDMDVEASSELALHRPTQSRPHLARRVDLPLTGRPPNYAPIRLAKRATLKKKPATQEQRPVEELNPDEMLCCVICFRRIPDDNTDRDFDEWVKCSVCGLWAHESCAGEGTPCPYDEGRFAYSS